ncbi:MAG TPA: glycoside hydrolase family 43 protein, partial [Candidatus Acidoferrales bacterium]|nr:glycoside hydrolase family 43 protein [Candidatus Acidoferrales bacterium]
MMRAELKLKAAGGLCRRLAWGFCFLLAGQWLWSAESTFRPGERWLDTDGKFINAHGGGILFHAGVYYWYGELKEGPTYVTEANKSWGGTRVINGGVSCYSSTNLYDWKNQGVALAPVPDDPANDLHPEKILERPKVIFNARTQKFVMWFHQDSPNYAAARSGVAVSDTPTGPFKYLGSFRPNAGVWPLNATEADRQPSPENKVARDFQAGQMARDMTLFVDDDGKAYQFYASEENATLQVSQLTDDYLKPAGHYARILIGRSSEAPAVFKHQGKYYLIASGCTGWAPNTARSAVADHIFGPWTELGNPCRGPDAEKTFYGQSTFVLPVAGQPGVLIAMFDRWKQWNLEDSRYLWLPLHFENGK